MAKIFCIVPRLGMVDLAKQYIKKNGMKDIFVTHAETSKIREVADWAIAAGAEILMARGLQAAILQSYYDTPLVEIRLTGQEMGVLAVRAKQAVEKPNPQIAVIGNHNMFCDMSCFDELYNISLKEYFVQDAPELAATTSKAIAEGVDIVIGGEIVCTQAAKHNCPSIFLESGEESISEAMRMAKSVAYAFDLEKNNTADIKTLLDYSFNGIIMVDRSGHIIRMNHLAQKLMQINEYVDDQTPIADLIPDLDQELLNRVLHGEEVYSILIKINQIPVIANIAPVQTGLAIERIIISFYEKGHVEEMEEEIRREQYHRGNIAEYTFENIAGRSAEFRHIVEQARTFAKYSAPVLIIGEQGTEKEMLAQCIHHAGVLSNGAYISFSCDSVPAEELDTALFGAHMEGKNVQKGLLDMAEGGILFIGEIQQLNLYTQYKLYRLIQKHTILRSGNSRPLPAHVRVIAANHCSLAPLVKKGLFREDLFYALNVLSLDVPPLRQRKEDIMYWLDVYTTEMGAKYSRYVRITSSALKLMAEYDWDGNLPQIRSFCERVVILAPKRLVDEKFIAEQLRHAYPVVRRNRDDKIVIYKDPKAARLAELMEECSGNRTLMAERLGVSKSTLWRYMKKYNLME